MKYKISRENWFELYGKGVSDFALKKLLAKAPEKEVECALCQVNKHNEDEANNFPNIHHKCKDIPKPHPKQHLIEPLEWNEECEYDNEEMGDKINELITSHNLK